MSGRDWRLTQSEVELSEEGGLSGRDSMANWRLRNGLDSPTAFMSWLLDRESERTLRRAESLNDDEPLRVVILRSRLEGEPEPERWEKPTRLGVLSLLALLSWVVVLGLGWMLYHVLRAAVGLALRIPLT